MLHGRPMQITDPPPLHRRLGFHVRDGVSQVMTVTLKDTADNALWSRQLEPKGA
jgi:hypothetical protein